MSSRFVRLAVAAVAVAAMAAGAAIMGGALWMAAVSAQAAAVPATPDTPFKLATFDAGGGRTRVGLVVGDRLLEVSGASAYLSDREKLPKVSVPTEMRALIEQYDRVKPRLYQIANYFSTNAPPAGAAFARPLAQAHFRAPIMYPWNLLAIAANYKAHAEGMGGRAGGGGFNASMAEKIVPDRDAPIFFAKSPRSCIIGTGEAYYIPDGRERTDWEGEMAIVLGRQAYMVPKEKAHDYVFGYSIMYDLSDRGGKPRREVSMFQGTNWFEGKSMDRAAPFGPFIVPKEFLPNFDKLHLVTKVNGVVKQDANTSDMIWDEAHQIQYLTSILTLYPGDVISSGTPSGTGAERQEFLKPGDQVTIEIEGIGTLTTAIKAQKDRPSGKATE